MRRRGIILAGGTGTRLHPVTRAVSKQLLPIYDKPMIYYPLTTLMLAGIREIMVITTPEDQRAFRDLLGDGGDWGLRLAFAAQPKPEGIAQAFHIAADFLAGEGSCLILGDNLLYGHGLPEALLRAGGEASGATIFAHQVDDPERYGVVSFDDAGRVVSIEEKPRHPTSRWAVPGLYFYDSSAVDRARSLKPSARGEYEITDLNRLYLQDGALRVEPLGRGFAWFDAGTHESLLEAAQFVQVVQRRQGQLIASPEEIAFNAGWISREALLAQARRLPHGSYGAALMALAGG
jgi:glucose-1-phosphate thymidylyltransferase